jgi:hypothetical protein
MSTLGLVDDPALILVDGSMPLACELATMLMGIARSAGVVVRCRGPLPLEEVDRDRRPNDPSR